MKFLEKDLEDIIWETSDEMLEQRGLPILGKRFRQLNLGGYGIADLVTARRVDDVLLIDIYELKKEKIGIGAFLQAIGYAKGIQSYMDQRKPKIKYTIGIYLIGKEMDLSGNLCFLTDLIGHQINYNFSGLDSIDFLTYDYTFEGINFKSESGYVKRYENFNLGGINGKTTKK